MARSVVSDLAGRVLAGRYLLHGAIGTGASGRVYVAHDLRMDRRVAVKVLHAALAEDAAFLRRFRAEARVAAKLQHPNIVTVFDSGEDEVPFLVLELLTGGSLRAMLDAGTRLSVAQAARVGRDVAAALEYAHARGILHRDVKPANLLFDEHGVVRVADFGLARALAQGSPTEPAGAVFGTARYASPEQASAAELDGRSDLYALALVLVEAVTGTVPFASDSVVGMLTARTQSNLIAPEELGALSVVVERAGRIDRDERYPDAATMRSALADVAESLPPPGPLKLAGTADVPDPHPTRAQPAAAAVLFDQDAIEVLPAPPAPPARRPGERRWVPYVVAAASVVMAALAALAFSRVGGSSVAVPGVVGLSLEEAERAAREAGLEVEVVGEENAPDPAGTVIEQRPGAGGFTDGDAFAVVVSKGPAPVAVPEITDANVADAIAQLEAAGFVVAREDRHFDDIPADVVASVEPGPGTKLPPESTVKLVVSLGHAPVEIPDVQGLPADEARARLEELGFTVVDGEPVFSDEIEEGRVVGTSPGIGTEAPYQSQVALVLSKGPDLVTVPDVEGATVEQASEALADAGLEVEVYGFRPGRIVRVQDPEPGSRVRRGSTVTLVAGPADD
ncbi:MAG: serine/threonine-protein kinase PknB [Acidimicrobiia bacterium]|nr:MAG: serine/threonine-protein kinase PknB [Acidimicrobiia bacterium]